MIIDEQALSNLCWTLISDLVITASTLVVSGLPERPPSTLLLNGFLLTVQAAQAVRSTLSQHLDTALCTVRVR